MPDPLLASARDLVGESVTELRSSLQGLPVEALNWRPAGERTNSIAVLVTHTLYSTRMWLSLAMGAPLPDRDRDSEFRVAATGAAALLRLVDKLSDDCRVVLRSTDEVDWATMRETRGRGGDAPPEVTAAYALIHPTERLRGHVDQMALMRHLWQKHQA